MFNPDDDDTRPCPRAHPVCPHDQYRDTRTGEWYCPVERDVELAARYADTELAEVEQAAGLDKARAARERYGWFDVNDL